MNLSVTTWPGAIVVPLLLAAALALFWSLRRGTRLRRLAGESQAPPGIAPIPPEIPTPAPAEPEIPPPRPPEPELPPPEPIPVPPPAPAPQLPVAAAVVAAIPGSRPAATPKHAAAPKPAAAPRRSRQPKVWVTLTPQGLMGFFADAAPELGEQRVARYQGQWIRIAGRIAKLESDGDGETVLQVRLDGHSIARARFDRTWRDRLAIMAPGDPVALNGEIAAVGPAELGLTGCGLDKG